MKRAVGLLACVLLGGCLDFVEPTSPWQPNQTTQLNVFVRFAETGPGIPASFFSSIQFFPGTDSLGRFLSPATEAVQVMDSLLLPDTITPEAYRSYSDNWDLETPDLLGTEFILRGPWVPARGETVPVVRWTLPGRGGPAAFELKEGADLVVPLAEQTRVTMPLPNFVRWSFDVSGPLGTINIGAAGFPPSSLRLPAELIPATANQLVLVRVTLDQRVLVAEPSYTTSVVLQAELRWFVTITP